MGKFKNWIKKKLGISRNENSSPAGAPPATSSPDQHEIELIIDRVVLENLPMMGNLINFVSNTKHWQSVFKALAKAESNFQLTCRYVEPPSLGKDAITGVQNTSEGLFQLSYQDSKYHQCEFDWSSDRDKYHFDKSKTIFDAERNTKCAMSIMNKLVGKKRNYIFNDDNYWAVLKPKNDRHSVFLNAFNQYQRA